ncbi:MAG: ABC transporter ATP-binding protein [Betaproteobacteria bacterium]
MHAHGAAGVLGQPAQAARMAAAHRGIRFDNLAKTYPGMEGPVVALQDATFDVADGEFVSVLGPSGCGKSTLLLLASGLEPPTSGSTSINGHVVTSPFTEVGIVFQDHALLEWRNVLDNIMLQAEIRNLPRGAIEDRAMALLQRTGLADFANKLPFELSGGMRQRASICRALVHDPAFLFFDEPFGALDALTREQMRIDIEKLWLERRPTVLFITHSIPEAVALSDRVVVMTPRPGRVDRIIAIDLPRPRDKSTVTSAPFAAYCEAITECFMAQGVLQY